MNDAIAVYETLRDKKVLINQAYIEWAESDGDFTRVYMASGKSFRLEKPIDMLFAPQFKGVIEEAP